MKTNEKTLQEKPESIVPENIRITATSPLNDKPVWIEPDLDFIHALSKRGGDIFKKCFQCGTCSATCNISPDLEPFPRKEMAWAIWGMKTRLLEDPDVWLCYQCNDCSIRCPRGARPGDMLAAVRQESVQHYAFPGFLAKWLNQPRCIPLILGIPAALLSLALFLRSPIEKALGISRPTGGEIVYSYSSMFPHWLLNGFFLFIVALVFIAAIVGVGRFWRTLKRAAARDGMVTPSKALFPSITAALKNIIAHSNFAKCTAARSRFLSHMGVFFGFIALFVVSLWVFTSRINPLIRGDFIYPFSFWSPWKMLANIGGAALIGGCLLMIRDRLKDKERVGVGTFFDWVFISTLLIVAVTGYISEVMHYIRLEPHRHVAYFVHLVFACTLILYLPFSKFAHLMYRTVAMVFAEHFGRNGQTKPVTPGVKYVGEEEEENHADKQAAVVSEEGKT